MASNNGLIRIVQKITKLRDCLVATSGNFSNGMGMLDWFNKGAVTKDFPVFEKDGDHFVNLLVINEAREIFLYENSPYPIKFENITYAMGSGRDFAIAAMACGKDAREAVLLTNELSNECGCGVDILTFD